jgi:hypothetical protein
MRVLNRFVLVVVGSLALVFIFPHPSSANPTTQQLLDGQFAGLQQWIENRYRLIQTHPGWPRTLFFDNEFQMHLRSGGQDFKIEITSIPDKPLGGAKGSLLRLNLMSQVTYDSARAGRQLSYTPDVDLYKNTLFHEEGHFLYGRLKAFQNLGMMDVSPVRTLLEETLAHGRERFPSVAHALNKQVWTQYVDSNWMDFPDISKKMFQARNLYRRGPNAMTLTGYRNAYRQLSPLMRQAQLQLGGRGYNVGGAKARRQAIRGFLGVVR